MLACAYYLPRLPWWFAAPSAGLLLVTVCALLNTACRDPGILPLYTAPQEEARGVISGE